MRRSIFLAITFLCLSSVCGAGEEVASTSLQEARQFLYNSLKSQTKVRPYTRAFNPYGAIVHLSYTCSLHVDNKWYPVVEVHEAANRGLALSGMNTIVVVSPEWKIVKKIKFGLERPLYCVDNQLVLESDLDSVGETEGNVLTFTKGATVVKASHVSGKQVPAPQIGQQTASNRFQQTESVIYQALKKDDLLSRSKELIHMNHACSLKIDGKWFPVVEIIQSGTPEAGFHDRENTITILSPDLKVLQKLSAPHSELSDVRPRYCVDNKLIVYGQVEVPEVGKGNVLTVSDHGKNVQAVTVDDTKLPLVPTGKRTASPQ